MLQLLKGMQKIKENLLWLQGSIAIIKELIADYITELSLAFFVLNVYGMYFVSLIPIISVGKHQIYLTPRKKVEKGIHE